ncbi:MAG: polysialyltransferase family glycosyltransferase [Geobacter sp.]
MNLRRHPQGIVHENLKRFRTVRRLLDSELHYYRFRGDRTGADDRIVDRIYTLPGFPHEYDTGKVVELPPFVQGRSVQKSDEVLKRALVIGQPLVVYGGMSRKGVKQVTQAIYEYLRAHGIEEIHYKSHPRDKKREYALDAYRELIIEEPLEQHLAHCAYGIVIGVCSTALLTSRMVLPEWCDVVSCGMNLMLLKNKQERLRYLKIFNQLSVKAIDA